MVNATAAILVDTLLVFISVLKPKKELKPITSKVDSNIIVNKTRDRTIIFLNDIFFILYFSRKY